MLTPVQFGRSPKPEELETMEAILKKRYGAAAPAVDPETTEIVTGPKAFRDAIMGSATNPHTGKPESKMTRRVNDVFLQRIADGQVTEDTLFDTFLLMKFPLKSLASLVQRILPGELESRNSATHIIKDGKNLLFHKRENLASVKWWNGLDQA